MQSEDPDKELRASLLVSWDRLGKNPVTHLTDVLHRTDHAPRDQLGDLLPDRERRQSRRRLAESISTD